MIEDQTPARSSSSKRPLLILALLPLLLAITYLPWREVDRSDVVSIEVGNTHTTYGEERTTVVSYGFPLRFDPLSPVWISGNMPPDDGYLSSKYEFFWSRYFVQLLLAIGWSGLILHREMGSWLKRIEQSMN